MTQSLLPGRDLGVTKRKVSVLGRLQVRLRKWQRRLPMKKTYATGWQWKLSFGAIPWHFSREIKFKKINSLKEALEEAELRRTLEEEEDSKKRVQAVTEDLQPARQEEGQRTKEARKGRRGASLLGLWQTWACA